jgi:hypothetical protein
MRAPQTVRPQKPGHRPRWHAAVGTMAVLTLLLLGLGAPGQATTAPTPSGVDWKCYETCRAEECTDNSLWCVATCLLICYEPEDPNGGGSAFVDVFEGLKETVIGIEENPTQPLEDLLPPVLKRLEQYQEQMRGLMR